MKGHLKVCQFINPDISWFKTPGSKLKHEGLNFQMLLYSYKTKKAITLGFLIEVLGYLNGLILFLVSILGVVVMGGLDYFIGKAIVI